ncbi:MAG: putative ATP-dependent carboligase, ATP-grasp superfamily [Deltaproteobacteria bacterium]|nr:putative ATP-dependent carboligase, ATP-grasp superfamily [Deltaproteobacteria bacterium]
MRIGAFELDEPIPELKDPYVLAVLWPWIDVNNVATSTLNELEIELGARDLGRLAKPGNFFDFTRYRPTMYYEGNVRRINVPNTNLKVARREGENDLLFLRLLEPHSMSEIYVDSVLRLFEALKVKRYCLIGSMYDAVPHTKPLIANGGAIGKEAERDLKRTEAHRSSYQGPTSIMTLITQKVPEIGIESIWFIISLPQYVSLEEDYMGKARLMEILNLLYNTPIREEVVKKAIEQRALIDQKVERTAELKSLIPQLETLYELRVKETGGEGVTKLSTELEELLWKISGKDVGKA